MKIYKLLSVLLEYPDQELIDHLSELRELMPQLDADNIERDALQSFIHHLQSMPLTELQADYVKTFDM